MTATGTTANDRRFLRQRQIEGFSQPAVEALRVIVVGAGAIGNEVVKNLVLMGVGHVLLCDFDRVESHNLTRSVLLRDTDIGAPKATAVAAHARALAAHTVIEAVPGDVHLTLGLGHLDACDVLIACTDNFEARIRLNLLCLAAGKSWVNTGIDARHATVEAFPFGAAAAMADATQPACLECLLPDSVYAHLRERQSCGGLRRAAAAQRVVPTTTVTASTAGALAVSEALRLAGCDRRAQAIEPKSTSRIFIDTLAGNASRVSVARAELCPACGLLPLAPPRLGVAADGDALAALVTPATAVHLSDAILWRCACTGCGPLPSTYALVGARAAGLSDAITVCASCALPSVEVEIRDTFEAAELADRFGGTALPAAFAWVDREAGSRVATERDPPSPVALIDLRPIAS